MSRGNYYYARGWVGHSSSGWTRGEIGRFQDFGDSMLQSVLFLVMGVLLQAFSAFADVHWLASALPFFAFVLGLIGIISMLTIPKEGLLYARGWTFVSGFLFVYKLIGTGEFLTDLIPLAIVILFWLNEAGLFDSLKYSLSI